MIKSSFQFAIGFLLLNIAPIFIGLSFRVPRDNLAFLGLCIFGFVVVLLVGVKLIEGSIEEIERSEDD